MGLFVPFARKFICTRCGEEFAAYALKAKYCPTCRVLAKKEYQREYYRKRKAEGKIYISDYAKQKKLARRRAWYRRNREKFLEYRRNYHIKNKERENNYTREYYYKNRELMLLNTKIRYYDKCVAQFYKETL